VKWDSSEPTELKDPMFANVTVSSASDSVETAVIKSVDTGAVGLTLTTGSTTVR